MTERCQIGNALQGILIFFVTLRRALINRDATSAVPR
jgi:hypothetical protein